MFVIRPDVYKKRDLADRLKIAFATAASAGLGFGAAWLAAGRTGAAVYALTSAYHYAMMEWRTHARRHYIYNDPMTHAFAEGQAEADRICAQIGLEPPKVFYSPRLLGAGNAVSERKTIIMGQAFAQNRDLANIQPTIAHEIGHIYNKDFEYKGLLLTFSDATKNTGAILAADGIIRSFLDGFSGFDLAAQSALFTAMFWASCQLSGIQSLIQKKASRIQEFRADRLAASVTDCPLDFSLRLYQRPTVNVFSTSVRHIDKPLQSHPPDSHRIKAIVQLCTRVPNQTPS